MGRYSSDSEEDRKKRKKKRRKKSRSRSRSGSVDSRHSSKKSKKSKRKYRSRSRSKSGDRYRRSRSTSRGRRSRSYDKYKSRSRSRDRYRRRSRSRSRDKRRRRSRSYDRSSRRSRSYSRSPSRKDKSKKRSSERDDPCLTIPGFSDMTPGEQARIRMQMALKAAAAADEKIKGDVKLSSSVSSLHDSLAFSNAVQDIESSGFSAASFKSNRGDRKEDKTVDKEEFTFGTAGELRLDTQRKPILIDLDTEELAHPSLYEGQEEKMERWIHKLANMRRRKLEGEALS